MKMCKFENLKMENGKRENMKMYKCANLKMKTGWKGFKKYSLGLFPGVKICRYTKRFSIIWNVPGESSFAKKICVSWPGNLMATGCNGVGIK
jgi:hypothetical protein